MSLVGVEANLSIRHTLVQRTRLIRSTMTQRLFFVMLSSIVPWTAIPKANKGSRDQVSVLLLVLSHGSVLQSWNVFSGEHCAVIFI